MLKPDFIPPGEEGWVWDPKALHTLFALEGLRVDDEFLFVSRDAIHPSVARGSVSTTDHAHWLCSLYANPEMSTPGWTILAWRRTE